ncbi:hypothetical protein AVEN_257530-1 [Araneus ventricosus]|uniref:Mutator-like transposase domain-containing protein n=1 Tax=Araneus ventricosus TaxID=182803 RepID=A0A4Y2U7E5_ARAVE|nr:hypothetical protein AVEN_257530-1 [Araneus ventricosus]
MQELLFFSKGFASSRKVDNRNDINIFVVYGLRLIGEGYRAGRKLISMLDVPFLSNSTYERLPLTILQAASKAAQTRMGDAAEQIRKTKRDVVECLWQKRGYSSLNGLVSCISIDTGNVLGIEAVTQFSGSAKVCFQIQKLPRNHMLVETKRVQLQAWRLSEHASFLNVQKL